jgi:septal ring factor EnvC (AmiA/AmiB activator)
VPDHQHSEIPDFIQRLFDESVRMQNRNEMLERQCEKLIAELRNSKDNNEKFISELRKSKEDNDALVAELRIFRVQNKELIAELRETKKQNHMLATKLGTAIDGIEGMKNQLAMMASAYAMPQPPTFAPLCVNDDPDSSTPEGLIRGEHQVFTEEIAKSANNALDIKATRV